ncbi:flagellar basal body rod protein FlgC [Rhizomicrobium palustre]|uniref:Flagellar basal body rod protein FlgC n=1 Tax=Rhizomicrobium palustre TaxID=189966 RepID=A0A846N0H7_9PROT|nr:hypothetical protein [Rhizomicrobium palustre]NIK88677.1 flagellar basal body rod protein FlgC [Rhizomicrobium palustre]
MMIGALNTAVSGLRSASQRFENAAGNVVKAASPGTTDTSNAADQNTGDLATAIVDSNQSALSFKANAAVFKTADKMLGSLLDTFI